MSFNMKSTSLISTQSLDIIAPCSTPRYATLDEDAPIFDLIVVGGNIIAVDIAQKISLQYPHKKILIVDADSELGIAHGDCSSRVLLPLRVATRAARHELVNRKVSEWAALANNLPVAPVQASIFNMSSSESPMIFFLNEVNANSPHQQQYLFDFTDDLLAAIRNPANKESTGGVIADVADDFTSFMELNRLKHQDTQTSAIEDQRLKDNLDKIRLNKNIAVLLDSPVVMINYKSNIIATKRSRFRFREAVVYSDVHSLLHKDTSHIEMNRGIRFFPNLPSDKVSALKMAHFDVDRTYVSFHQDFWSAHLRPTCKSFYIKMSEWHLPLHFRPIENNCLECIFSDASPLKNNRDVFGFDRVKLETKGILRALSGVFNVSFIVDEQSKTVSFSPNQLKKSSDVPKVYLTGIKRIDSNHASSKGIFLESRVNHLKDVLERPVALLDVDVVPKIYFVSPSECNAKDQGERIVQQLMAHEDYIQTPRALRNMPKSVTKKVDYGFEV